MNFSFAMHQMVEMAQFTAQLIREGVTFTTTKSESYFTITLTGGY